jgi:glutamine synthetase
VISIFLGDELEALVTSIVEGSSYAKKKSSYMSLGTVTVPQIRQDNTDRNRTSPFAFTGNKFEFRMVGASQNIALANIMLNTAVASSLSDFADEIEAKGNGDEAIDTLIAKTFREHKRILFSGNSYSKEWEKEAEARGLSNFRTAPEAYAHFTDEKNVALFGKFGVMSETEMRSRREIFFGSYRKIKNIEARTMMEMTARDFIPAVSKYIGELAERVNAKQMLSKTISVSAEKDIIEKLSNLLSATYETYSALERAEKIAVTKPDEEAAFYYKNTVNPKMDQLRKNVDAMEILTAREAWPIPTYGDIIFKI